MSFAIIPECQLAIAVTAGGRFRYKHRERFVRTLLVFYAAAGFNVTGRTNANVAELRVGTRTPATRNVCLQQGTMKARG
jgi:hypothetical protein